MAELELMEASWNLQDIQEAVSEGLEEAEIELFAIAAQIASRNARMLRRMARAAYEHRRNRRALDIFSFEWGMSAGNMARAVGRHKEWFSKDANASVQQMRILFVLGQLDANVDKHFYAYWRDHSNLQPWELQRMVTAWKKKQSKAIAKPHKIKFVAQAIHLDLEGKLASMELVTPDSEDLSNVVDGAKYDVSLAPEPERSTA